MRNKAILVYSREMKVMFRDRRLILGVVIVSLVVMPFLMGLIGNLDKIVGSDDTPVDVLVFVNEPPVIDLLQDLDNVRVLTRENLMHDLSESYLIITKENKTYKIEYDSIDRRIARVALEIRNRFENWRDRAVTEALSKNGISPDILNPFLIEMVDSSDEEQKSAFALGLLVPYLVIILLVANSIRAIYIAVGEKQHNTIASLLVSTTPRHSIVIGKSLAIMTFSIIASVLLIIGMVLFANFGFSISSSLSDVRYSMSLAQMGELLVNIMSVALFVSSVIMFLGTLARNSREAGIYTSPLIYISIVLAVFSMSSSNFSTKVYAIPILGNVLAMRDSFLNSLSWIDLLLPILSNLVLFSLFLWGSIKLYNKETVLFRN
ncbi:ABC transporter permease [candidate division KSB1 bacterium]|nr:ABC transporter permease [candidate division KSB1 bacterium]